MSSVIKEPSTEVALLELKVKASALRFSSHQDALDYAARWRDEIGRNYSRFCTALAKKKNDNGASDSAL